MKLEPRDKNFAEKVKKSFSEQAVMNLIGAEIFSIKPGKVRIKLPFSKNLTQQNNFIHAGIITTIVDSACGYAAFSLMPENSSVLSVEFKVNLLRPAIGDYFLASGKVIKSGKTLSVVSGDVFAFDKDEKKHIAAMTATMMCLLKK